MATRSLNADDDLVLPDNESDVSEWFTERRLKVRSTSQRRAELARASARSRGSSTAHDDVWVDLVGLDERVLHPAYGSGNTLGAALARARERFIQEQGDEALAD